MGSSPAFRRLRTRSSAFLALPARPSAKSAIACSLPRWKRFCFCVKTTVFGMFRQSTVS
ncbi:hypothetical protein PF005_g15223 [Phytophthora fragariae]|uniref:Uncharacterized protein n=1 Tax=Phytophthora fragariae TaxID=53985 RepID=A0A6A3XK78_9STRA|nr:hypothetical protein PF003_g38282 [Phytophthora fragariae]KAE9200777.1 hypothetical protein PF005_g15223 [Phytophthora fragariae]KAE9208690.1 hypothetical protein PF004_g16694 [Phytophthora fragariae]KAE9262611.1 hypothetical protein PF008_g32555 [Phytophthora fragariae]